MLLYDSEDLTIQRHFIEGAKPSAKQYETALSLIRSEVQGWRFNDLLRETGFSRNALQNILADLLIPAESSKENSQHGRNTGGGLVCGASAVLWPDAPASQDVAGHDSKHS